MHRGIPGVLLALPVGLGRARPGYKINTYFGVALMHFVILSWQLIITLSLGTSVLTVVCHVTASRMMRYFVTLFDDIIISVNLVFHYYM